MKPALQLRPDWQEQAGFNDHGEGELAEIVPAVDGYKAIFDKMDCEQDGESNSRTSGEIAVRLLQRLTQGTPTPAEIGRRVLAMQYLINPDCSQRLLAKRMGVSAGKVSSRLKRLQDQTKRQAKGNF